MLITLFVSAVASMLAYAELAIQGREEWVLGWIGLLIIILLARLWLTKQFLRVNNAEYFSPRLWRNRFYLGVVITGLMLGCGAALLLPHVTVNMQLILHSILLGMGAGAIAYLSTSFQIYVSYLVTTMLPITLVLLTRQTFDGYILGALYLFMMVAYSGSVRRMNLLINDALYYRFDSEALVDDLQHLLNAVSMSNKALETISITDELTGASNYRAFRVRLEQIGRKSQDTHVQLSLVKLNLDYFHEYNAFYGAELGDQRLIEVADLLMAEISEPEQMLARLNGAEFAYILPGMSCENARLLVLRVNRQLEQKRIEHCRSKTSPYMTMSIGLSSQTLSQAGTSRELLGKVDAALKLAKEKGRNRIEIVEN